MSQDHLELRSSSYNTALLDAAKELLPEGVSLDIFKDNGKGIQSHDLRKRDSFGVLGMQERAHLFGGSLTLAGEPGKGTTLRVKIPG